MTTTPLPDFLELDGTPDPRPPGPPAYETLVRVNSTHSGGPDPLGGFSPQESGNVITTPEKVNFPVPQNKGLDFLALNPILADSNIQPRPERPMPGSLIRAPRAEEDPYYQRLEPRLQAFLRVLEKSGRATKAAEIAGVPRQSMYRLRKNDDEFARLWKQAISHRAELIEDEAIRRAIHGVEEPVFYMGAVCGHKRVYSDALLSKLLEGNMPEKYRQNHKVEVEGNVGVNTLVLPAVTTPEEWLKHNKGTIIDVLPESSYD